MNTPLISFIVTAYNLPSEMLAVCIRSILSLPLMKDEREILLIDDGSTVPATEGLGELSEEVIAVWQPNQGAAAARNKGVVMATGQYIQFVDGDDYILTDGYAYCLRLLKDRRPNMVVFQSTSGGVHAKGFRCWDYRTGASYMLRNNLHGSPWGYVFQKDILGGLRFTQGIVYGEDEAFTPRLFLRSGCLCVTNAEAYCYRQHPSSLTQQKSQAALKKRLDDALRVITLLQGVSDSLYGEEKDALCRRVAQLSMDYLYNTIRFTHDSQQLDRAILALEKLQLFPLPDKAYTYKYVIFRGVIGTRLGRWLLLKTIK